MLAGRLRSAALLRACRAAPDPCALLQHGAVPCGGSARGEKTSAGASVVAACILERLPIVTPSLQPWEADYLAWQQQKRAGFFKTYPKELTEPKSEDEAGKVSWTAAPVSGSTDNLKSAQRKAQDFVFLVVRKRAGGPWQFPEAAHQPGETIRETGVRALSEAAPGLDVHYLGNAPSAHHSVAPASTLFFMRACFLGGDVQPASGVSDWAWVTKEEAPKFLAPELHHLMARAL